MSQANFDAIISELKVINKTLMYLTFAEEIDSNNLLDTEELNKHVEEFEQEEDENL